MGYDPVPEIPSQSNAETSDFRINEAEVIGDV